MTDDPRLGFKARLEAKTTAWQKQRGHVPTAELTDPSVSSNVTNRTALWQERAEGHQKTQKENPFSAAWKGPSYVQPHKDDEAYGRPKEGTKTEYRGKQAGVGISSEIVELCRVIHELGVQQQDGTTAVTFGNLFDTYTKISNKLVGMLLRARKQKLVNFQGEMLFQGRDNDVIIWLVQMPDALQEDIDKRKQLLMEHKQHAKK